MIQSLLNYPKEPYKNLEWRQELITRASKDPVIREIVKNEFFGNVLFAFNAFFWTLDIRQKGFQHRPFCTYKYQDKAIIQLEKHITQGEDIIIEKSRDMGATWIVLMLFLREWLKLKDGGDFLCGSRKEDYVDSRGDPRTHFEKIRYALYRLPKWLLPKGFKPKQHDNFAKLINPENGQSITGESNNPNFSTQGRYNAIFFDEFAKWENTDVAAWRAAGDATPCRMAVSTAAGAFGQFYKLVASAKTKKVLMHWTMHPLKRKGLNCEWPAKNEGDKHRLGDSWRPDLEYSSEWYKRESLRRSQEEMDQEVNINYLGAGRPVFKGKSWSSLMLYHKLEERVHEYIRIVPESAVLEKTTSVPFDKEDHLIVYDNAKIGARKQFYAIGVDVGEGKEHGDYSFLTVLNRQTKNVDAVYYTRMVDENTLGSVILAITKYIDPNDDDNYWVGIETTGPGLATFDKAMELGIGNLFMAPRYDVTNNTVSYKKGWKTDLHSRKELIAGIGQYLNDMTGNINCQIIVGECMMFVRNKHGKPQAKAGCNDDGLMSFGIALQVDQLSPEEDDMETMSSMNPEDYVGIPLEELKLEEEEDNSIYARCLQTAMDKQAIMMHSMDEFIYDL